MKICITGGAGMIGSTLTKRLVKANHSIAVIDNLWRGKLEYLLDESGEYCIDLKNDFHNLDIGDLKNNNKLREILSFCDILIHLADVVAGIAYVFDNQYEIFVQNNLINTNIFKVAKESEISKIIYVGSACSFPLELQIGLKSELHDDDLFPANPESAYGWSKLIGQLELRYLSEVVNFEITTLLLHNVFGPNCEFEGDRAQVIPSLINRIIEAKDGETIEVWGSGEQGRAFVYVDDVADAIISSLTKSNLPNYMQIGPNYCTSIKELVKSIIDISGKQLAIYYDTSKPEGDKGRYANYEKALKSIGWNPKTNLEQGLKSTYNWINTKKRG